VRGNQRLVLVLAVIGLIEAVQYTQKLHSGSVAIVALAGSLVLAAAFGAARAASRLRLGHRRPRAGHVEKMVDGVVNEVPRERVNRE
jgi:hypothetical protein